MAPDSDRPVWPRPLSSADVDKAFDDIYGEAARHSEEDRRLIRFAEQQMGSTAQNAIPAPRKFLVERRGRLWVVSVSSYEALRKNGLRAPSLELFIREGKNGFVVEKTEAGL